MTPQEIQKALQEKKTTPKAITGKLGVSEMIVSKVVHGMIVSDRIMKAVALAIGKPKTEVLPGSCFGLKLRRTSKALGRR